MILHERLGNWARQLRPRLYDLPIRWFETRSIADLDAVLTGVASPIVLIDLGSRPAAGLLGLRAILRRASDARILVLDPEVHHEAAGLARELGATHLIPGFVPPPVVASLLRRWVKLAQRRIEHRGWSRALTPDPELEPWSLAGALSRRPRQGQHDTKGPSLMFGKTNSTLTERDVLDALKGVKDPDLGRDLVDLGMIKDIKIGDGTVALTVNLTTPACPLKAQIERDVRDALESRLPGEWTFNITMGAEVRGKGITETGDIPGIKNVIAVGSGKGGVGKSTMAAAIAYGLRSYGASVGLMDADVYGPSIPHLVGASGPADGPRRAHPADRDRRPEADVDGLPARARARRHHARADAPRDHAAVPSPGRLGRRSTTS